MAEENEINIGPPQNESFLEIWNKINDSIKRLNELTKAVPTIGNLKSNSKIDQSKALSEVSKQAKEFEKELMFFLESAHDFRGNPKLSFKKEVDVRLSTWHYLNLLHSRIEYLERSYFQLENQIQRTEDFIHKHNSNLKADRSLSYGRKSIWLGIAGILLGIIGSSFSFFQSQPTSKKNEINDIIAPVITDSTATDSSSSNEPTIEDTEIDTLNTEN